MKCSTKGAAQRKEPHSALYLTVYQQKIGKNAMLRNARYIAYCYQRVAAKTECLGKLFQILIKFVRNTFPKVFF